MRYAKFILPFLLLGAVEAHAQANIRKAEPASNSVRSLSSNDLIRQELNAQLEVANKRITDLEAQLKQATDALTAVTARITSAEENLQQTHNCVAQGRVFNGSVCIDLGFSSPVYSGIGSGTDSFVAPGEFTQETDMTAPISTLPPELENIVEIEEAATIGGSQPAQAPDMDTLVAE